MKKCVIGSLATVLTCAGLALAQSPEPGPRTVGACPTPPASVLAVEQPPAVPSCEASSDGQRLWFGGEYLLWSIKDSRLPPLAVPSPFVGVPALVPGAPAGGMGLSALGQPGTVALFGGPDVDNEERSGGRVSAGYSFDDDQALGLEGSYFFLGSRSVGFAVQSDDPASSSIPAGSAGDPPGGTPASGTKSGSGGTSGGTPGTATNAAAAGNAGGTPAATADPAPTGHDKDDKDSDGDKHLADHGHNGATDGDKDNGDKDRDRHRADGDDHHGNEHGRHGDGDKERHDKDPCRRHHGDGDDHDDKDHGHRHHHGCGGGQSPPPPPPASSPPPPPPPPPSPTGTPAPHNGTASLTDPATTRALLSSRLQGAEANGVMNIGRGDWYRLDLLGGLRWLELNEGLTVSQVSTVNVTATGLSGQPNGITSEALTLVLTRWEQFSAQNNFYGGQLGARLEFNRDRLFVNFLGKLGLGDMHEDVEISGTTTAVGTLSQTNTSGATQSTSVSGALPGWLAQASNIGTYTRDRFAVVPEATVHLGYRVTENVRAAVGYTFLYCSEVVRPGDQIDRLQGTGHPAFSFSGTDFWAQGVDVQLEFRF